MNLNVTSRKRLVLLWAFAIGWFYLGSLINFHQHHIWGKSLIPQINACSRNKGKSLVMDKSGDTAGFHLPLNDDNTSAETVQNIVFQDQACPAIALNPIFTDPFLPPNEGSAFSQLRGPPQS